jgi:hypothetical protein
MGGAYPYMDLNAKEQAKTQQAKKNHLQACTAPA